MSEPKRYFLKISQTISGVRCDTYEHPEGEFINYDEYALLKKQFDELQQMKSRHGFVKNAVIKGHEENLSAVEIINKYGVNEKSVYIIAKNLGIKLKPSRVKNNG